MTQFDGTSALVTGGADGIGRAIAEGFLRDGGKVHILDVDAAAIDTFRGDAGSGLSGTAVDMGDADAVAKAVSDAGLVLGGFDNVVNNVGIAGPTGPIEGMEVDAWQQCINVNLNSMFYTLRAALPAMKAKQSGSIVNIASTAGLYGYPLRTPYAASKWAIIGMTKSLAIELGQDHIRCNAVCPGSISGDRMKRVIAAEAEKTGKAEQDIVAGYKKQSALGTFIDAEEIADMVMFLCSDAARKVNGQVISVDGYTETAGS